MQKTATIAWRMGCRSPPRPKSLWKNTLNLSVVFFGQQTAKMLVWETILGFSWVPQLQYQTKTSSPSFLHSFNPSLCFSCHPPVLQSGTSKSTMGDRPQLRQCAQCSNNPRAVLRGIFSSLPDSFTDFITRFLLRLAPENESS